MACYESVIKMRASLAGLSGDFVQHVYPTFGKPHTFGFLPDCWCEPKLDTLDPRIIVHNPSH